MILKENIDSIKYDYEKELITIYLKKEQIINNRNLKEFSQYGTEKQYIETIKRLFGDV
jgi:hypothetical protein